MLDDAAPDDVKDPAAKALGAKGRKSAGGQDVSRAPGRDRAGRSHEAVEA
jgi:hypothetical protein